MKDKERQKIRDKHIKQFGKWRCQHCYESWPCDVIKILDSWDKEYGSVEKIVEEYKEALSGPEWDD